MENHLGNKLCLSQKEQKLGDITEATLGAQPNLATMLHLVPMA